MFLETRPQQWGQRDSLTHFWMPGANTMSHTAQASVVALWKGGGGGRGGGNTGWLKLWQGREDAELLARRLAVDTALAKPEQSVSMDGPDTC